MKEPSLAEYAGKRDFKRTDEPPPGKAKASARAPMFVIQKHDATRLHYDFRLEIGGTLKSWAVPKGPPFQRGDRRLAMRVEDHPLDYARFEGTIAPGNYGAGTVMVWDIGTFEVSGGDPAKALAEGKLHLTLHGKKLQGEWTLVKMSRSAERGKEPWLLLKSSENLEPLTPRREDQSALTGRSLKRIASDNDTQWQSNRTTKPTRLERLRRKTQPAARHLKLEFIEPMKAQLRQQFPREPGWIYEIKFDGIRALAIKRGADVKLFTRLGNDVTGRFAQIASELRGLDSENAILDGEVVALEPSGRSSFQLLQMSRLPGIKPPPICYYVFDALNLDGKDLGNLPLIERKKLLEKALPKDNGVVRFSASLNGDPEKLLDEIRKRGLEGLIGKKEDSTYEPGRRNGAWFKIKVIQQQEFVIGGYTQPKGSREHFGSVLVGYYDAGKLLFASKVGTGFDRALLKSLLAQFRRLAQEECPFTNLPEKRSAAGRGLTSAEMKRCSWIQPKLICEVIFNEWTLDGHLRQPVYAGLREDKRPEEVARERPLRKTSSPP
jgi:bifunctional non-homologous end joining protein LigD